MVGSGALILIALLINTVMQQTSHDNENISDTVSAKIEQKTEKETVKTENHNLPQIEAGVYSTIALKKDGTVLSTTIHKSEDNRGQNNVKDWESTVYKGLHRVGI